MRTATKTVRQLSGQMENQNRSQSPTNINREVAGVFGRASTSTASAGSGSTQQGQQGTSRFRRLMNMRRIGNGNNRSRSRTRPRSEKTQFPCNWFCEMARILTLFPGKAQEWCSWKMATCCRLVRSPKT